jgi:hypothetical protein
MLCSEATRKVIPIWDEIIQIKLQELGQSINRAEILGSLTSEKKGYICRKCFLAYERYQKLRKSLVDNAHKAVAFMSTTVSTESNTPTQIGEKHPRCAEDNALGPSSKRPLLAAANPLKKTSPAVSVG